MKVVPLLICVICSICSIYAQEENNKARVFVLTDINNEPDDEESLVRFLLYSNEYDIEGIVATTSCHLRKEIREDLIRKIITAYGQVRPNLQIHADGYPTQQELETITASGQATYGLQAVGSGKSTEGSRLLLKAAQKEDNRPLWVCLWGGANTLAQALSDARNEMAEEELKRVIGKLRVYSISDQDDAGPWIRSEFPELFYIVDPSEADYYTYYRSTWTGISGDVQNQLGVNYHFDLVDNPWLKENIIENHGPLGACYPLAAFIMEGDTPSFLGLINNGLGWSESPGFGGWGGRYALYRPYGEIRSIWTSNVFSRDRVEYEPGKFHTSNGATIWRWRDHFQYDFAARMDWCIADSYQKANHNPTVVLNGDTGKKVLYVQADGKKKIQLSAAGTSDPDGNALHIKWWIYQEAGSLQGASLSKTEGETTEIDLSRIESGKGTVHVILQVNDDGFPNLYAYRRVVVVL
ncbi:hypothetical protein M2459_000892 [Parabacteroides sp. PF5-5]|uniref:DUF1593 domain-containing protein n=1 Tax=unclassified Parabacteroides TaxID=2649774 RepID=UPI002476A783|nr:MULTISPECIES: DUF1593 domain-containing protein [unclassified Parabacteroides]MDH6304164.1 hypothetical protein [Parabacteroides sp. PH5-39]MDH6315120.1 hypothetical protein [Parabacteroides sp. PF5-13]MDH6318781.1 hypothetical protein [Parabacteroides sp. PH5-13]MDH6322510.1 hypothetical protein [Parabacteroides sp. PH5-8]MDH6326354.1 hypothetical protein [Parabacteroides sp. PH5-41]